LVGSKKENFHPNNSKKGDQGCRPVLKKGGKLCAPASVDHKGGDFQGKLGNLEQKKGPENRAAKQTTGEAVAAYGKVKRTVKTMKSNGFAKVWESLRREKLTHRREEKLEGGKRRGDTACDHKQGASSSVCTNSKCKYS